MKPRKIFTFALAAVGYIWLQSDQKVDADINSCYIGCENQRADDEHMADDALFSCNENANLANQACLFEVDVEYKSCKSIEGGDCETTKAHNLQACDEADTERRNNCTQLHTLDYELAEENWQTCLNDCTVCDSDPCNCISPPECCSFGTCS